MDDGSQVYLLHKVQVIVACGSIGAESHVYASVNHLRNGGESASKLKV